MKKAAVLLGLVALAVLSFALWKVTSPSAPGQAGKREVRVAAAADLKFAFDDVVAAFQARHPDIAVPVSYGASGSLFAQLTNRAPFDLFLSADVDYPRRLAAQGQGDPGSVFVYAVGHLVILVPRGSKMDLKKDGARALLDPEVRKIAIANPTYAPYGRAAEAALKSLGIYEEVKDKLVRGENVAQAAQFLGSGAVDAAIVPQSLAGAEPLRSETRAWPVPPESQPRIEQGGVVLAWAQDRVAAEALGAFLIGAEGQAVLRRHGFGAPGD